MTFRVILPCDEGAGQCQLVIAGYAVFCNTMIWIVIVRCIVQKRLDCVQ